MQPLVIDGGYGESGGQIVRTALGHDRGRRPLRRIEILDRGPLHRIGGRAVASRLPAHITDRMVGRVQALLQDFHVSVEIKPLHAEAACPGAGIFLIAEYENTHCGFSGLGAVGRPAEVVAEEAVVALLGHYRSGEAFDEHLADQVLLPLALAASPSRFTAERSSAHLVTNASVIEQFGLAEVTIEPSKRGSGVEVSVTPQHARHTARGRTIAKGTKTKPASRGARNWNAVVSVYESEFRAARKILRTLGEVWSSDYHNVLVMRVDDPHRLAERFGLWVEREPGVLNTISRLVPAHSTFDFQDVSSFEATAREALLAFLPSLANKSFHIRVHRRGFKHRISSHDEERRLGAFLLESSASGGAPGRLAFEDPDALVAIETVGQRAGVSVWTREELRRYPFIRVD